MPNPSKKIENPLFRGKSLLITGGTGSFGKAMISRFINTDIGEIRIFSRDEKKQDDLRNANQSKKLKFFIGDVRDYSSLDCATRGVDYVFHAAALKQVPSCEFYPIEAVKTNIQGTENVITSSTNNNVKRLVLLSTDKAVYPVNAMGMSKALAEKVLISKSRFQQSGQTILCATRYGNVMASRGSVIPLFVSQIERRAPLTITDQNMTRFMMSIEEAVNLVLFAFKTAEQGDVFVQKSPACSIGEMAKVLQKIFEHDIPPEIIGTRHGEKLFECLASRAELNNAIDLGHYYKIPPDNRDLNYSKYFDHGQKNIATLEDYTSHNTHRLTSLELKEIFLKLPYLREKLNA